MNINAKVPMNSARSLDEIRLDISNSRDEIDLLARSGCARERYVGWGWPTARESAAGRRSQLAYSSTNQLRLFQSEGLRYHRPVRRIRALAIGDVPLLDVQLGVAHRTRRVLEQHLLLRRRHLPEQVDGLLPMVIVDTGDPIRRSA